MHHSYKVRCALVLAASLLSAGWAAGQSIHGGTAPNFPAPILSERGQLPSFRSEMPTLADRNQFDRWETPNMPLPTFTNPNLPFNPSFESAGDRGWYDPQPMGPGSSQPGATGFPGASNWDQNLLADPFFRFQQNDPFFEPRGAAPSRSNFYVRGSIGLLPYPAFEPANYHGGKDATAGYLEMPTQPGGQRRASAGASSAGGAASPVPRQPSGAAVQLTE